MLTILIEMISVVQHYISFWKWTIILFSKYKSKQNTKYQKPFHATALYEW